MRTSHWTFALLLALALLVATAASPAWAADPGAGAGGGDEMPGFLRIDVASIVVAIATFVILLFLLTKLAWKPILNGLQQRETTIRKAVDDAQQANEEARALAADYREKLETAKAEAQAIADEAKKKADATRQRIEDEARKQADETLARSVREIHQAKETALDELLQDVASIAAEAASRIVRKEITPDANAALVDDVVRDFVEKSKGTSA